MPCFAGLLQTKDAKTFFEKFDYQGGQPKR